MRNIGLATTDASPRRSPEPPNDRPLIAGLILAFAFAMECGAAYAAWRLNYGAALGRPSLIVPAAWTGRLIALGVLCSGSAVTALALKRAVRPAVLFIVITMVCLIASRSYVYAPTQLIQWQLSATDESVRRVLLQAWLSASGVALGLSFFLIMVWRRRVDAARPTTSHGSAHWGDPSSLVFERGLVIGRNADRLLRLEGEGHVLTVAPTRSGKGVGCVIPNLE